MNNDWGYLIPAIDHESNTYLDCARRLAVTVKQHDPGVPVAVMTNHCVSDSVFDLVIPLPFGDLCEGKKNKQANDWQVYRASPFHETIKLEADMLLTSPCQHWWSMFRLKDIVISTGCRDWRDTHVRYGPYRKTFENNHLPDTYNAVTYWRKSKTAKEFFDWCKRIWMDWPQYCRLLKFADDEPSTDLVYAMAAMIVGTEKTTLPSSPNIIHMKQKIITGSHVDWTKELVWEWHQGHLRINTLAQWGVFHYHRKDWIPCHDTFTE